MNAYRILHVYSSRTSGGAEKVMLELAAGLERRGHKNFIAAPGGSFMFNRAGALGLPSRALTIRGSFDLIGIARLLAIVIGGRIDIVHAHQGKVFWPCIFVKFLLLRRIKVVFHRHAQLPHRFYSRLHYRAADKVIAISNAVGEGLRQRENVPPSKISIVYNGTDFGRFNTDVDAGGTRREYGLGSYPVVGTIAAMNMPKGKGQQYLIEAAQIVSVSHPETRYLIVGDGPLRAGLERMARRTPLADKIIFTGHTEKVERFMAAMDVVCLLSWDTEGFGQVLVEAQAMGKPVIGTCVGGIPETFSDNETGLLIPPEDSRALAAAICRLLADADLRSRMGAGGFERAHKYFSIDAMVTAVNKIYDEAINERA